MFGRASHMGLYPEKFHQEMEEFFGNFSRAFTQIGLINTALYRVHAERRADPWHAPIGTPEHRTALLERRTGRMPL
ncbi:hypothetical protein [Methanoculleus sp.]|uniref:hypothetical protein n=2 Tax=Methanoculleus sp. TaxID=90427 RepID=UPI001BD4DA88|nr:hypothetical protein [Methanoculleus sp.]